MHDRYAIVRLYVASTHSHAQSQAYRPKVRSKTGELKNTTTVLCHPMPDDSASTTLITRILTAVLNTPQFDAFLFALWHFATRLCKRFTQRGLYEVLDHEVTLTLLDAKGHRALYTKRQKVRFLQDSVIAYQDQAWGDGNIFASYSCSPGVAVDRYREGYLYRILISLHETKNYGDIEQFLIERTIEDGFTGEVQDFQTRIDHLTHAARISVIFPQERPPKSAFLLEQSRKHAEPLAHDHLTRLPDGRTQVTWQTKHPRLFEGYTIRWEW